MGAFLLFFHSAVTIMNSFLPIYFQHRGLTPMEIGWLLAVGPFAALFSQPFWGYMSDKYKTVKNILLICLSCVIVVSIVLFQMKSFWSILLLCGIFFTFMAPTGALGDSLTQRVTASAGISFGKVRMWGSIGFAITSLVAGQVFSVIGIENILYLFLFYAVIAFCIVWKVTDVENKQKPVSLRGAFKVAANPRFFLFLFMIVFITVPHRTNDSFIGIYIKSLGGSETLIGWAWFIAVVAEAVVFLFSSYWMARSNEIMFLIIAAFIYCIRWFLFSVIESPYQLIFLQVLHGLSYGVFYLCSFQFVTKLVPKEFQATGQLLFLSTFFAFSGIIGSLAGGKIFDEFGGDTLYQISGCLALLGSVGLAVYYAFFIKEKGMPKVKSMERNL